MGCVRVDVGGGEMGVGVVGAMGGVDVWDVWEAWEAWDVWDVDSAMNRRP